MSKLEEIRKKSNQCYHYYNEKTMIKLLLLIDEISQKGCNITYKLSDDVEKYGEEVVLSTENNKQKLEEFSKLANDFDLFIKEKQREIENMIETLSKLINTKKEGE